MVTAKGRPSGTATTITVIAIMKASSTALRFSIEKNCPSGFLQISIISLITKARNVAKATDIPMIPIKLEIASSLIYRGVSSLSISNAFSAIPDLVRSPTATTIARP
jgi:hypothetical protein